MSNTQSTRSEEQSQGSAGHADPYDPLTAEEKAELIALGYPEKLIDTSMSPFEGHAILRVSREGQSTLKLARPIPEERAVQVQLLAVLGYSKEEIREICEFIRGVILEHSGSDTPTARKSDVQIAKDLAQKHADDKNAEGSIWRFQERCWQAIPEDALRREIMEYDGTGVALSKGRIDSTLACLGYELGDDPEFFAGRVIGINCADGLITFGADGEPSISNGHDREHRQRHVLAGHWKPGTTGQPPQGSLLATYLKGVFAGDPEATEKSGLLQEIAGVAALGYGTRLISPKAIVLRGRAADNGKSQFLDMLVGLLPPTAICTVPPDRLGDDNKIMLLVGALLNVSGELSGAIASERFKSVVTGDLLDARKAYGRDVVQFRAEALHVYAANQLPAFRGGMDKGVRRRLIVVEFLRTIPEDERIYGIGTRIAREEPDALLAWAVEGARRVLARGRFNEPASSKQALAEWTQAADPVAGWIADRVLPPLEVVDGEPARVTSAAAFRDFRIWHQAEEGQPTRIKQRRFTEDLRSAALPRVRYIPGSNGFRGFEGLRLKRATAAMQEIEHDYDVTALA